MENDTLILVDENDNEIGNDSKINCHYREPKLHRAFSVFIFNGNGDMLITQRSESKKTWPLHWSNACCSHPRKGEITDVAALRRTKEELGISCALKFLFKFQYAARYSEEWGEKELDWVYIGMHEGPINPDPGEIAGWKFISVQKLQNDIKKNADNYTPWFKLCAEKVIERMRGL
ncbi:MAG: isopentenyl-diphosphate delta-isomerase [Candidatus Aenigmarchaeota archaeon]|nr:isopentenyl-diphosphate delta-isomerase [Candidatus Aenigmarchaeota archaeon]